MRFETGKRKLQYLSFNDFFHCAQVTYTQLHCDLYTNNQILKQLWFVGDAYDVLDIEILMEFIVEFG